jgi:hypothetical protein
MMLVLELDSDFSLSVKGPHDGCSIFVPTQMMGGGGSLDPLDRSPEGGKSNCRVTHMNDQLADRFESCVHEIEFAELNSLDFEATAAATIAAVEAVNLVSLIIREGQVCSPAPVGLPSLPVPTNNSIGPNDDQAPAPL